MVDRWEVINFMNDKLPTEKPEDVTSVSWRRLLMYLDTENKLKDIAQRDGVSQTAYKNSVMAAVVRIGRRHWIKENGDKTPYPKWLFWGYHAHKKALRQYGEG